MAIFRSYLCLELFAALALADCSLAPQDGEEGNVQDFRGEGFHQLSGQVGRGQEDTLRCLGRQMTLGASLSDSLGGHTLSHSQAANTDCISTSARLCGVHRANRSHVPCPVDK